ncbi:dTDP-4-dehydrorhamnose reductase [Pseudomonas brassicacearum]|uniref:dTDP-4-dehydrorhamnose reductase n=1 Tax=Pseudomonas brassicacearum TaxID=930166 RepID=A0AAW8M3S1_9PSED|nr:dTDP-4-dehydrorhamnose reductase [Pseudomonas brassicacearum]MDR6956345.1 dTDP-4-dehydrorhamnose reductase [Pseudomonas brassicacearum]
MKILLLGKNGQVGWELQRSLAPLGEVIALDRHPKNGLSGDLMDINALRATIRAVGPDIIVNAAAYNFVDKAEIEPHLAEQVNEHAVEALAEQARDIGAWFVHYSTDYVFDGRGCTPWSESDIAGPLNRYGLSKLAGERSIQKSGCNYLLFRTSWVYSSRGKNFATTMLRLGKERDVLDVIDDQVGAPTGADLIADVTALALRQVLHRPELGGLYHLSASGEISWCGYARHVIEFAQARGVELSVRTINPIKALAYPTLAKRPLNSRLNTQKLTETFSLHLPDWRSGVTRMLMEILK